MATPPAKASSVGPDMSDLIVCGASHAMRGSRMNPAGEKTRGAHRREDLLLAPRAREIALRGVAQVLARAGQGERLAAVDVRLARGQAQRVAAVLEPPVDA
jgi:hypothetical protein